MDTVTCGPVLAVALCASDVAFAVEGPSYWGGDRMAEILSRERAAAAKACSPYGIPNLPRLSRELRNLICSGVGPDRGYDSSVRMSVVGIGADIFSRCARESDERVGDLERVNSKDDSEGESAWPRPDADADVEVAVDARVEIELDGR
jgi:hypothetical protein